MAAFDANRAADEITDALEQLNDQIDLRLWELRQSDRKHRPDET
jgi:hypothetical protein